VIGDWAKSKRSLCGAVSAFSVAGEKQAIRAEYGTRILLERFSGNPAIEKARAEFENAQKNEEGFHKDFDGIDFTLDR
jgi:hypothetical protein